MIAGASNFFRKRAWSFSNAARKEERGRATSAPDTAIAGLPSPDENANAGEGGEGASAPDILLSQASSTSEIIPSAPLFKPTASSNPTRTQTHSLSRTPIPIPICSHKSKSHLVPVPVRLSVHSLVLSPAPIPALNPKIKIEEDPLQAHIEITPPAL
jgi:hypothetical protein